MKKIAVLVSGGGTNLQALIDAQNSGILKSGKIAAVVSSCDDAYALTRAANAGIPSCVVARKGCTKDEFNKRLCEKLNELECDLVILAGFMCILTDVVLKPYANRIINVHPSLIPSFCGDGFYGLHVHEAALSKGVKVTGATVHFVNEIVDGGAIILQKAVEIQSGDTPEILQKRVMEQAEWKILPYAAELFCADKLIINNNKCEIKGE
ncbi:MAG: phosphoribosylglycinamide formyltransferase [Ruminococcaceae bacterium]|nr:phosphoribosylglycinamide formyltransferase [Oscillospiraceae bacterium]